MAMTMTTTTLPTAAAAITAKHAKSMERGNQIRNPGGERGDQEGSSQD